MGEKQSVVVVGAGAMGGVFGALMADTGARVTLLDANERLVKTIAANGVRLITGDDERRVEVEATSDPKAVPEPELVFFFVKCHHTENAARDARAFVGDATTVVSLQNGWGNADVLAAVLGRERLIIGVTYTSATATELGVIRTSGPARTVIGPVDGSPSFVDVAEATLRAAGFDVERPKHVLDEVWKKLVLNAATLPTAALTGLAAGDLARLDDMRWLVDRAAAEAVNVGQAQQFEVTLDERLQSIHAVLAQAGSGKGSMLQDVEAGRRTEIEVISGAVLAKAAEHGIEVPVTRSLYAMVAGLERGQGLR